MFRGVLEIEEGKTAMLQTKPLYSTLANDPDLGGIVELFVEEMPNRIASLQQCLAESNWEELRRVAHQLKGAAGSYGFHPISPVAAHLEQLIKQSQPEEEVLRAVEELVEMCRSVRAGLPE